MKTGKEVKGKKSPGTGSGRTEDIPSLLVVGAGMGARRLVDELDALRLPWRLTVVGEEDQEPYNRIHLPDILGKEKVDWLMPFVPFRTPGMTLEYLRGTRVDRIHPESRTATLSDGRVLSWDKLVLATGSRPFFPPPLAAQNPHITSLRTQADFILLKDLLEPGLKVVVLGGGPLGIEAANRLASLSCGVTVLELKDQLMAGRFSPQAARALQKRLEAQGIGFRLGRRISSLEDQGEGLKLVLDDRSTLETRIIVVSTGVLPRAELAKDAGLEVKRGVVIDTHFHTSHPDIFALGECAEFQGRIPGLLRPVYHQAKCLSLVLAGQEPGPFFSFETPMEIKLEFTAASLGQVAIPAPGDQCLEALDEAASSWRRVVIRNGSLLGAEYVGDATGMEGAEEALEAQWMQINTPLKMEPAKTGNSGKDPGTALLNAGTTPAGNENPGPVLAAEAWQRFLMPLPGGGGPASWPDSHRVCDCNAVDAGTIRTAIAGGAVDIAAIRRLTGAGGGCGTCHARVQSLLDASGAAGNAPQSTWSKVRNFQLRGYSPLQIFNYVLDTGMAVAFLTVAVTGLIKYPGLLDALGISLRQNPWPDVVAAATDLHDLAGLWLAGSATLHLLLHLRVAGRFWAKIFGRGRKPA